MEKIKEYSEFYGDTIFVKKLTAMRHHAMDSTKKYRKFKSVPSVS